MINDFWPAIQRESLFFWIVARPKFSSSTEEISEHFRGAESFLRAGSSSANQYISKLIWKKMKVYYFVHKSGQWSISFESLVHYIPSQLLSVNTEATTHQSTEESLAERQYSYSCHGWKVFPRISCPVFLLCPSCPLSSGHGIADQPKCVVHS
jgi:hypothetical protein